MRTLLVPTTSESSSACRISCSLWTFTMLALLIAHGACAQAYLFKSEFGTSGSANGQFSAPAFIGIDPPNQNIVVFDSGNARVQRFSSSGSYVSKFAIPEGSSYEIFFLALDPTSHNLITFGFLFSGTFGSGYYQIYSSAGTELNPSLDSHITAPAGFAVDPATEDLFETNSPSNVETLRTSNGKSFVYASEFGSAGSGNGQFSGNAGLAIDATNHHVVVADGGNQRVEFFTTSGTYLSQVATGPNITPSLLAIDPVNQVLVVTYNDSNDINELRMYSYDGTDLGPIAPMGSGVGQIGDATGIAIDPVSHDLIVADGINNKVLIFTFGMDEIFHDGFE